MDYKEVVVALQRWLDGELIAGAGLAIRSGVVSLEVRWEERSGEVKVEELPKDLCLNALLPLASLKCSHLCLHNAPSEDKQASSPCMRIFT